MGIIETLAEGREQMGEGWKQPDLVSEEKL